MLITINNNGEFFVINTRNIIKIVDAKTKTYITMSNGEVIESDAKAYAIKEKERQAYEKVNQ